MQSLHHQLSKPANSGKIASQTIPTFRGGCHTRARWRRLELQVQWKPAAVAEAVAAPVLLVHLSGLLRLLRAKLHSPVGVCGCGAVRARAVPPFELASASSVALCFASTHCKRQSKTTQEQEIVSAELQRNARGGRGAHDAAKAQAQHEPCRKASGNP